MSGRKANGPCGWCRHHVSVHAYVPGSAITDGPKKCGIPGCSCCEYVRPLSSLREQRVLLVGNTRTVFLSADMAKSIEKIDKLIAKVEENNKVRRAEARRSVK